MRATLASLVQDWRRLGKPTAVVRHRGNRSFRTNDAELANWAGSFAAGLQVRGIGPGECVVLWGRELTASIAALFCCMLAVPLDAAGSSGFVRRVIAETEPRWVMGDRSLLGSCSWNS